MGIYPSIHLSIYQYIYLSIYLSIYLIQVYFTLERVHLSTTMCLWDATRRGRVLQSTVPQRLIPPISIQCNTSLEFDNTKIIRDALSPGLLRATPPIPTPM